MLVSIELFQLYNFTVPRKWHFDSLCVCKSFAHSQVVGSKKIDATRWAILLKLRMICNLSFLCFMNCGGRGEVRCVGPDGFALFQMDVEDYLKSLLALT